MKCEALACEGLEQGPRSDSGASSTVRGTTTTGRRKPKVMGALSGGPSRRSTRRRTPNCPPRSRSIPRSPESTTRGADRRIPRSRWRSRTQRRDTGHRQHDHRSHRPAQQYCDDIDYWHRFRREGDSAPGRRHHRRINPRGQYRAQKLAFPPPQSRHPRCRQDGRRQGQQERLPKTVSGERVQPVSDEERTRPKTIPDAKSPARSLPPVPSTRSPASRKPECLHSRSLQESQASSSSSSAIRASNFRISALSSADSASPRTSVCTSAAADP